MTGLSTNLIQPYEGSHSSHDPIDYKLERCELSSTLVVVFSAINIPRGKYGFTRFFSDVNENILFINSPGNQWYQDIIDPIHQLIDITQASLGIQKTFYYGSSMGAYAALLFALLRNDGSCLSYGPNIRLGIPGSHSGRYNISFDPRYKNICEIDTSAHFPIHVIFGAFDLVDACGFFEIRKKFDFIDSHLINSCHACHQHLFNAGIIHELRECFLNEIPLTMPESTSYDLCNEIQSKKEINYDIWSIFLTKRQIKDGFEILDVGDAFHSARLLQVDKKHGDCIEIITWAIDEINRNEWLSMMPKEYIGRFHFIRAESMRRSKDGDRGKADYEICAELGFKRTLCLERLNNY